MKKGWVTLFAVITFYAQQHNERVIGLLVDGSDQKNWKKIESPAEIHYQEIVAVYNKFAQKWFYAQVIEIPGDNFAGLVSCVKDGAYYDNFAVDFKQNIRKLQPITKLEKQETLSNEVGNLEPSV